MASDLTPEVTQARTDHGTANDAIEWAVHVNRDGETATFLKAWQEGDLGEWPEFYEWLDTRTATPPAPESRVPTDQEYEEQLRRELREGNALAAETAKTRGYRRNPRATFDQAVPSAGVDGLVTQADRDAAIPLYTLWGYHETCAEIAAGKCDSDEIVLAFARHRLAAISPVPASAYQAMRDAGKMVPKDVVERGDTYEIGQWLFNSLRSFLATAAIDASDCNLVIELPDRDAQRNLVSKLQRDARAAPPLSAARIGNHSGKWQGVSYEFSVKGWREALTKSPPQETVEDWDRPLTAEEEARIDAAWEKHKAAGPRCTVPPEGWWCSREPGHEGPCAARPNAAPQETVEAIIERCAKVAEDFDTTGMAGFWVRGCIVDRIRSLKPEQLTSTLNEVG